MIVPARTEEVRRPGWICSSLTYNLFCSFKVFLVFLAVNMMKACHLYSLQREVRTIISGLKPTCAW